jgi:hypothetical protein
MKLKINEPNFKTMKKLIFAALLAVSTLVSAQTGIGTTTPDASAALDVESTTRGFLPQRMTEVQMNAISLPNRFNDLLFRL